MKNKEEKAIEFQLENLDTSLFEGSDKIIKVKVEVGSGAYEDLSVVDDDVMLECTMAWNTGSFEYDVPAKELIKILKAKPVDKICSADLADYDKELIKVADGDLECKKINDIEIENEKEIVESLKGTSYEITSTDGEDLYQLIADQMNDLYSRGVISDSEYTFHSLFSMGFFDEELGDLYVDWHYWGGLKEKAKKAYDDDEYEAVIELYQDYLKYETELSAEDISIYYERIASSYKSLENHDKAEGFYKKAIDSDKKNIQAVYAYSKLVKELGDRNDEVFKILNQCIANNPTQPKGELSLYWIHLEIGELHIGLGSWKDAKEAYLKAKEYQNDGFVNYKLGVCCYNLDKPEEAFNFYKESQKEDRFNDATIEHTKGECLKDLEKYQEAIDCFKISIERNNEEYIPYSYKSMGVCYLKLGDFSNAVDSLSKGLKDKWAYQNLGKAYFGLEKFETALENFKKVTEIDPKYKWAYHGMGDCLFQMEQYDEALTAYESLIERDEYYYFDGDTYHILINMSLLYHFKGEFEKANGVYKLDNGYSTRKDGLWWHYCKKMSELGKKGELFTSPKNIKLVDDKTIGVIDDKVLLSKIFYSRGASDIYYYSGENQGKLKFDLMISDLDKAVELGLDDHEVYFVRASCLSGLFHDPPYKNARSNNICENDKPLINIDRAIEDLKKYLEIENVVKGHILLINCCSKNNDLKGLGAACKNAVSKFPSDDYLWSKIGQAWKDNKDYKKSLEAYKKAAELDPDYAFSFKVLGEAYLDVGDSKNAIKAFKKAESLGDDNELFNWCLSKAYLLDNQLDLAHSEINKSIASYSGDKNYFIQYAKVCGEIHKDRYPLMGELMLEYIEKTSPQNGRNEENKKKHKDFLGLCDSFNATHCEGSGLTVVPEDKKHALNGWSGDSCLNELFEIWEHFKESDIKEFIEHGSYKTKYHLSRNKSLNKNQILMLLESGSFTVLENAASNKLVDLEDVKNIVSGDDGSYSYSYKLLGVLSNPNVDAKTIEGLKDNKYGWVRKKVCSIINNHDKTDLNDKYKVLGLLENKIIDSKTKTKLQKALSSLETVLYKMDFNTSRVTVCECVFGEHDLDEIAPKIADSISNEDDGWSYYCSNNWYEFGESEYGMDNTSIGFVFDMGDGKPEPISIFFGNRKEGWETKFFKDLHIDPFAGVDPGKFIHQAYSTEVGEYAFGKFDLEFEFRPEEISFETTDRELLISGIDYTRPGGEDDNYSSGEIVNTRTKGTDIYLSYKTHGGAEDVYYDDILGHVDNDKEKITEATIKKYFEFVLNQSKKNEPKEKKNLDKKQDINQIISNIDVDVLGEVMQEKAESIQYSDYNIVIFNIEAQDLETGTFEKMEEIGSVEYGDWNMLGGIVSAAEVTRIKEYFTNDLKRLKEDEGNDVDDCSQIYISVLYCKGIYVWSGMVF